MLLLAAHKRWAAVWTGCFFKPVKLIIIMELKRESDELKMNSTMNRFNLLSALIDKM